MLFTNIIDKLKENNFRLLHVGIIVASIIALLAAYYVEYFLDVTPCPLCVYQRFPYLSLIKISLTGVLIRQVSKYSLFFLTLTLFGASLLASYHIAVERHFIEPSKLCSTRISIPAKFTVSEFKNMLYNQPSTSCDSVPIKIFGLSMAECNLLVNLALLAIVLSVIYRHQYAKT